MKIATTIDEVRDIVKEWKAQGLTVGLVPTMGFLHEGHESLIRHSVGENHRTVVSIFVNPIQFGQKEDLETYPRDLERDGRICQAAGADLIFNPSVEVMYPSDFFTYVDMTTITEGLCGSHRPGHFKGVCTVVSKLFNIVTPDRAYFGQKDAQQLSVIKKMVDDLNFRIEIIGCPTVREEDGLAKSSRNVRLSPEERQIAPIIYKSLMAAADAIEKGERSVRVLIDLMTNMIQSQPGLTIDYVEIVDWVCLQPIVVLERPALIAVAVNFGTTRLIDNYLWE